MSKISWIIRYTAFVLAFTFAFSCSGSDDGNTQVSGCPNATTGNNTVSCDGQTYRTVQIGSQVWMAKNLDYNVNESRCNNDLEANCVIYGRLYNWATAMALPASCNGSLCASQISAKHRGICPSGWHIPSNDEWEALVNFVGGKEIAGTKLKTTSGWSDKGNGIELGNGTDDYGFSALPGGYGGTSGGFHDVGDEGYWWSSSESNGDNAYRRIMDLRESATYLSRDKIRLYSVRCIKD